MAVMPRGLDVMVTRVVFVPVGDTVATADPAAPLISLLAALLTNVLGHSSRP